MQQGCRQYGRGTRFGYPTAKKKGLQIVGRSCYMIKQTKFKEQFPGRIWKIGTYLLSATFMPSTQARTHHLL